MRIMYKLQTILMTRDQTVSYYKFLLFITFSFLGSVQHIKLVSFLSHDNLLYSFAEL